MTRSGFLLFVTVVMCGCATASPPRGPAETSAISDRDSLAIAEADRIARVVGYPSLRHATPPRGVREIRVWTEVAIASPDDMYRIVDQRGRVTGSVLRYWRAEHQGAISVQGRRSVAFSDLMHYTLAGQCGRIAERDSIEVCEARFTKEPDWAGLLHALERLDVWTLLDEAELPGGRKIGLDGWSMTVEVRGDSGYRRYSYYNPDADSRPAGRKAFSLVQALAAVDSLIPPSTNRRVFRGLYVSGPKRSEFRRCGQAELWGLQGNVGPIARTRPGRDTVRMPVESLYAEVRGMLAFEGLPEQWGSPYPQILEGDSVLASAPWTGRECD